MHAAEPQAEPEHRPVDFAREVLPVLSNKCFVCHGPDTQKKDMVRLDSFEAATRDLGGYRAIDPKAPADSELIVRIHDKDDPMPPVKAEKQLTPAERDVLTRWVKQGGKYAKHWAFVPPKKVTPKGVHANKKGPGAKSARHGAAVIDAYVKEKLRVATGGRVSLASRADKPTLARRAALTLTGLPPDIKQLQAFVADDKPGAYERYIDQLLASERYGEHQARYWLDAVRYGDTHGLHLDNKRAIYPYRDWVIYAMNRNLPLDTFITWQLAGDLLPKPTLEQQVATGFVRMNPTTAEGGAIPAEFQAKNNFDRTEMLGTVLMGMTYICARCHTHKYDPITHTEYFQLFAFFNSTAEHSMDGNKYEYGQTVRAPKDIATWHEWAKGEFDAKKDGHPTLVAKELPKPRATRLLKRGEYNEPHGDPLTPDVPAVMGSFPEDLPRNRLGLAKWLTDAKHPLTARVLVNRIWQRVYGEALVRTPADFGLQGDQPTHPQLLDWLAVELIDSGWDLKHMLKLMVMSETFQQRSARRAELDDPENKLFARGPRYRLDAEVLRDVGLWASELLDPTMGGEGIKPPQPPGMWRELMHPGSNTKIYKQDQGPKLYRRSLYVYWKRTSPHPMMTLFDAPSREVSCVRRSRTNTALQSLGLLNETQRVEMARSLAARLIKKSKGENERLDLLFTLLGSRKATEVERQVCAKLLASARERYKASPKDAAALLSTGDAPRDDKLDPVEHAAWTQVTGIVLASDVAILVY